MENLVMILYIGRSIEGIDELRTNSELSVVHKSNALEAINYLKSGNIPDAVLSEMFISGGNGLEMHQWIRDREEFDRMAFILISYEFKEELIKTAFARRIDDYFVLPFHSAQSLVGRIRFLIEFRNKYPHTSIELTDNKDIKYKMPFSKRLFDLLVAISALIVLSPILLIIVVAIRLESKGKVYYISKRVGREPFDFYKLRSMRVGADKELNNLAKERINIQYPLNNLKSILPNLVPDAQYYRKNEAVLLFSILEHIIFVITGTTSRKKRWPKQNLHLSKFQMIPELPKWENSSGIPVSMNFLS